MCVKYIIYTTSSFLFHQAQFRRNFYFMNVLRPPVTFNWTITVAHKFSIHASQNQFDILHHTNNMTQLDFFS